MEYTGLSLISLNDSSLEKLRWFFQNENDTAIYKIKKLLEQRGYDVSRVIDSSNFFFNKQHNITEYLRNNLSLIEIKVLQAYGIKAAREKNPLIPSNVKKYYKIKPGDGDIHITDAIKESEQVMVFLSCIANDLMNSLYTNPLRYRLAQVLPQNRHVLKRTDYLLRYKELRNVVVEGLKTNVEQILSLNSDAKIVIYGLLIPKNMPEPFKEIFSYVNGKVKALADEYKQSYIDLSDLNLGFYGSHPSNGQLDLIASRSSDITLQRLIEKTELDFDLSPFLYGNGGINGANKDVVSYSMSEKGYYNKLVEFLVLQGHDIRKVVKVLEELRIMHLCEIQDMSEYYNMAYKVLEHGILKI